MLTIRLTRKGKKNQPFFRVVVIDKRNSTKGGRAVEDLGYVDPLKKRKSFKKERIQYWISKGAQTSATMHNFLVSEKIIDAKKIHVSKLSKKKLAEMETAKASADAKALADKAEAQKVADTKKAEESQKAEVKTDAVVSVIASEAKQSQEPTEVKVEPKAEEAKIEVPSEPEKDLPAPEAQ